MSIGVHTSVGSYEGPGHFSWQAKASELGSGVGARKPTIIRKISTIAPPKVRTTTKVSAYY